MKTSFILPSCNYNIGISKEELQQLLDTGHILMTVHRTDCYAGRTIFNGSDFETLDKKEIGNHLYFRLDDNVADIEAGDYGVQFLTINVIKEDKHV
jgi:hypothetical protein